MQTSICMSYLHVEFHLLAERGEKRSGIKGDVIASAPFLVSGLGDGDLTWRELVVEGNEALYVSLSFEMHW